MAFIRRRITKAGVVSTALVQSYRKDGKPPRQRVIANLRGAETLTVALGRLAAERDKLRKEHAGLDLSGARKFYELFTQETMAGREWTADERKEIDRMLRLRRHYLKRADLIDSQLARIERDGVAIKKHCTANANEIRAEVTSTRSECMMLSAWNLV